MQPWHGMPPPMPLVTNRQQGSKPACPGPCLCLPDAPQLNPIAPGPSPCPHPPVHCRPTYCRAACRRALCAATPAGTHPPDAPPTTTERATPPPTRRHRALASLAPPDADHGRPHAARAARAHAAPPPCPPQARLLQPIRRPPLATTPHHTATAPLPLHPGAAEKSRSSTPGRTAADAVPPLWCVSDVAAAT